MKGNPAVLGSPLTSKPTWSDTSGCSTTSVFFSLSVARDDRNHQRTDPMDKSNSIMAKQVALAACEFEQQRTGNVPKSVTVVLSEDTLVITLHGA
jgi:hypothetical protein